MKNSGPMKNSDCHRMIGSRNDCLNIMELRAVGAAGLGGSGSVIALSTGTAWPGYGAGGAERRPPCRRLSGQAFLYSDQKSFQSSSVCCTGMFR